MEKNFFQQFVEAFILAKGTASEDAAYSNMVAKIMTIKQSQYGCYDMSLFVTLFKYARTQKLRDYALENMGNVLDGYLSDDEIYEEFEKMYDLFIEDEIYQLNECIISSIVTKIQEFVDFFNLRVEKESIRFFCVYGRSWSSRFYTRNPCKSCGAKLSEF